MTTSAVIFLTCLLFLRGLPGPFLYFPFVLLASALYYSILGPAYWVHERQGYFVGVNWSSSIATASVVLAGGIWILLFSYRLSCHSRGRSYALMAQRKPEGRLRPNIIALGMAALGITAALYVYASADSRSPLFLVAYQFSDVAIPALIFGFASKRLRGLIIALVILYVGYGLFTGYRYKIFLLLGPIFLVTLTSVPGIWRRTLVMIALGGALLVGFALMTVARANFHGLDMDGIASIDASSVLYGLFAESNVIFGLSSIIEGPLLREQYIYFQPVLDAALELIPRIWLPDRETGAYHWIVAAGLFTEEGYLSGTTYPFVGEYLLMFGYPAMIVASAVVGWVVAVISRSIIRVAPTKETAQAGVALVAFLFGYYFISRGYMPQFIKAVIFILAPYYIMSRAGGALTRTQGGSTYLAR